METYKRINTERLLKALHSRMKAHERNYEDTNDPYENAVADGLEEAVWVIENFKGITEVDE